MSSESDSKGSSLVVLVVQGVSCFLCMFPGVHFDKSKGVLFTQKHFRDFSILFKKILNIFLFDVRRDACNKQSASPCKLLLIILLSNWQVIRWCSIRERTRKSLPRNPRRRHHPWSSSGMTHHHRSWNHWRHHLRRGNHHWSSIQVGCWKIWSSSSLPKRSPVSLNIWSIAKFVSGSFVVIGMSWSCSCSRTIMWLFIPVGHVVCCQLGNKWLTVKEYFYSSTHRFPLQPKSIQDGCQWPEINSWSWTKLRPLEIHYKKY